MLKTGPASTSHSAFRLINGGLRLAKAGVLLLPARLWLFIYEDLVPGLLAGGGGRRRLSGPGFDAGPGRGLSDLRRGDRLPRSLGAREGHVHPMKMLSGRRALLAIGLCGVIGWTSAGCGRSDWEPTMAEGRQALARGDYAEAERLFLAAADRASRFEADDARPALTWYQLAQAEQAQRKFDQAELHYGQALTRLQQVKGEAHPEVAAVLNNLGVLHRLHGQYAEAEPLLKRALAIKERALGPAHPDVALSLNNLAMVYDTQGRYDQAEPLYRRALAIRTQALGSAHEDTAKSRRDYAALLRKMQRDREAAEVEASVAPPR